METQKPQLEPGQKVFSWESYNYHPYRRGVIWMIIFCSLFFGCSIWAIWTDPKWGWLTAFTFLITAASYFFAHRNGNEKHQIDFFEKGFCIDQKKLFLWQDYVGYWFVYDESVAVVNLATEKNSRKISLQMGEVSLDEFRKIFEKLELPELTEKKEGLVDLWIRALKL